MATLVPWTQRLREMVQSGPSPFDLVLTQMMVRVPPGRGFRDALDRQDWSRSKRGGDKFSDKQLNEAEKNALIRQGQRRIAYQTIWTQKRQGYVEIYEQDGVRMVGRGPRFPEGKD